MKALNNVVGAAASCVLAEALAAGLDAPVIALVNELWEKALAELGPAADQSRAHQAWGMS